MYIIFIPIYHFPIKYKTKYKCIKGNDILNSLPIRLAGFPPIFTYSGFNSSRYGKSHLLIFKQGHR